MTNPTSNFGWQMPTSTDLVTDLPADFEVFGQAVDTSLADLKGGTTGQVLKKNSNTDMDFVWSADAAGMTNPMTTTGDTIYSSSGSTPARLGIGSTGQVLTVAAGVPSWASPSTTKNYSLLNTGGTALTGAQDITISGISGQDSIFILVVDASSASAGASMGVRLNGDTANNYARAQARVIGYTTWDTSAVDGDGSSTNSFFSLATQSTTASGSMNGYCKIDGAATAGLKVAIYGGGGEFGGGAAADQNNYHGGGVYNGSAITSVTIRSFTGNFDAGTVYLYGSA